MKHKRCRLYLVTPSKLNVKAFCDDLSKAFDGGDISALQVRLKDVSDDEVCRAVDAFLPIASEHGSAVIINDYPHLVKKTGANGAHIGQSDTSFEKAREMIGTEKIIGVTCHGSPHLAMEAGEQGFQA